MSALIHLVGGLGAMGVGEMWSVEEFDPKKRFENWETVPEKKCPEHECKCTADCPPALKPKWVDDHPYASYPRCWQSVGHKGQHFVGSEEHRVFWGEVGLS